MSGRLEVLHDAHCHVGDFEGSAFASVLEQAAGGRRDVVWVTTSPAQYDSFRTVAERFANLHLALGLHPQRLPEAADELPALLEVVDGLPAGGWLGELGLDGVDGRAETEATQRRVLEAVFNHCTEQGRGEQRMTLHGRRAAGALLDVLSGAFPRAVLHWFSGNDVSLDRALAERRWFSVNPAMAASRTGRSILRRLPHDRVLYESDGPYAWCEGRPATPSDSGVVVQALSSLWGRPRDVVAAQLNANWSAIQGEGGAGDAPD